MGGGFRGGGMGGGFRGGGMGGGFRGGGGFGGGGFRGGGGFGFNRGFNRGFGFNRFGFNRFGFNRFGFWPYWNVGWASPWWGWGAGWSYWPGYSSYCDPTFDDCGYGAGYGYAPGYDPNAYAYNPGNVTVVYPQTMAAAPMPGYSDVAHPVIHTYDQYGQETHTTANGAPSSPIYLIAMKGGVIRAADSYWVQNGRLHYVTLQHQEETVPLSSIDRTLTNQLNRERHVNLNLGTQ